MRHAFDNVFKDECNVFQSARCASDDQEDWYVGFGRAVPQEVDSYCVYVCREERVSVCVCVYLT